MMTRRVIEWTQIHQLNDRAVGFDVGHQRGHVGRKTGAFGVWIEVA